MCCILIVYAIAPVANVSIRTGKNAMYTEAHKFWGIVPEYVHPERTRAN